MVFPQGKISVKFSGSHGSSAIMPLCLCGSKFFSCGIFCIEIFFMWVFHRSNIFSHGYFVGPVFFIMANYVIQRS